MASPAQTPRQASLTVSSDSTKVYSAAYDAAGSAVYVREYDGATLNYSGVTSTTTGALNPLGTFAAQVRTAA